MEYRFVFLENLTTERRGRVVNTYFLLERSRVQISDRRPAILNEDFRGILSDSIRMLG
jgi:hypothetical protein